MREFIECDICRVKPGSPTLCSSCLSNRQTISDLRALINSPEIKDFIKGVKVEAAYQIDHHGPEHDSLKTAFDWFWVLGYLSQKAADAALRSDIEKAQHHCISSAALLANWHRQLSKQAEDGE